MEKQKSDEINRKQIVDVRFEPDHLKIHFQCKQSKHCNEKARLNKNVRLDNILSVSDIHRSHRSWK